MPVTPTLGKLRQEDLEFEAILDFIATLCLKIQNIESNLENSRD